MTKGRFFLFSTAMLLAASLSPLSAYAAECVRILGFESEGEKQTMDTNLQVAVDSAYHLRGIYEPLVSRDSYMNLTPVLAESWESNADGSVWTFHLRKGVKFHNGQNFGAEDVVFSFKRVLDANFAPAAAAVLTSLDPDGIRAIDEYTVEFKLKQPNVELPLLFGTKYGLIVPRGSKPEDLRLHGIGTGPFMQDKFTPGAAVRVLKRNPDYWQQGYPKAKCLEIRVAVEPVGRIAAVMSGEADLVLLADPTTVLSLKNNPQAKLLQTPGAAAIYLVVWIDTKPFSDVRVRKAMKLLINRQEAVNTALLGFGEVGNDNPVPPSSPNSYSSTPKTQDLAQAKKLLADAGYSNGLTIDLYASDAYPGMLALAQAYVQWAKAAGITVNLINTPADGYWDNTWMKKPFVATWRAARPTNEALQLNLHSKSKWNDTHWYREDYDALLAKAAATLDPNERKKIYQQAGELVSEEGGEILPLFNNIVSILRSNCKGYTPNIDSFNYDYKDLSCD